MVADVTNADDCERVVRESVDALGGLDGLVLNVGSGAGVRLEGTSPEACVAKLGAGPWLITRIGNSYRAADGSFYPEPS